MKIILLALVFLLASPFTSAGRSCPGVTSMTPAAACKAACGTPLMLSLCTDTLSREFNPKPNEITAYALLAVRQALESQKATVGRIFALIGKGGLSPKEVLAYMACLPAYNFAGESMGHIYGDMLPRCFFSGLLEEYQKGINGGIESCRDGILQFLATPLYALIVADRNKAVLAFFLGRLLLGQ